MTALMAFIGWLTTALVFLLLLAAALHASLPRRHRRSPRPAPPPLLDEHERLAALLPAADRQWLARMADVLPWGWVVSGMAEPRRGGVVGDPDYPTGVRLVVAPPGPAGASSANRR